MFDDMAVLQAQSDDSHPAGDPVAAILDHDGGAVLAVITGVEGPSYRPVGAMMAILDNRSRTGSLSSGCIEADIVHHAMEVLESGQVKQLRYGRGSPFIDISLPCGGGLDILLFPQPDRAVLQQVFDWRSARKPCSLFFGDDGAFLFRESGETGAVGDGFILQFLPENRFVIFGKGPEAATFSALVSSAGYDHVLISPDAETLETSGLPMDRQQHLVKPSFPADVQVDEWTAIVLFFHDHDWEPPILRDALKMPAFYIGAQGSQRARDNRKLALSSLGVSDVEMANLRGPIGLIPSTRDARTLAVSVLAEVLAVSMEVRR